MNSRRIFIQTSNLLRITRIFKGLALIFCNFSILAIFNILLRSTLCLKLFISLFIPFFDFLSKLLSAYRHHLSDPLHLILNLSLNFILLHSALSPNIHFFDRRAHTLICFSLQQIFQHRDKMLGCILHRILMQPAMKILDDRFVLNGNLFMHGILILNLRSPISQKSIDGDLLPFFFT